MAGRSDTRNAVRSIGLAAAAGPRWDPVAWTYRAILFLVAAVLVVLPLVYCVFALIAFALVHHRIVEAALALGLGWFGFAVAYSGPALVVVALTAFLLKPFVAPRAGREGAHLVTRGQEPDLHAFVNALCRLVGAPHPTAIEVTCNVNAGADLRRGLASLREGDVVLTIGLPLVAGLDLQELAGVLAHELGHFSQRAGLRLLHLVRATNRWFERAVFEQDSWDHALARLVASPSTGIRGLFMLGIASLSMGVISLSRVLLWPLMMLARFASVALLRQLELDADRVHAGVVGSECFERTVVRTAMLSEGTRRAALSLEQAWAHGRLGDDLTALIVDHADSLEETERAEVLARLFEAESDWLSSHPSPRERIEATGNLDRNGVLDLAGPATDLFRDFDELARRLTLSEYRAKLDDEVTPESLVETTWIRAQRSEIEVQERAALRFFGLAPNPDRPLSLGLSWMAPPRSYEEEFEDLVNSREAMLAILPQVHRALAWLRGDEYQRQVAEVTLAELEDHAARRLSSGLRLLEQGRRLELLKGVEALRSRARELRAALVVFEPSIPGLSDLLRDRREAERLGVLLETSARSEFALKKLMQLAPMMAIKIGGIRAPLSQHPYPYPHASRDITIGRYALEGLPDATDPATVLETTHQLTERLLRFYTRVLGELATTVEAVEATLGLEALDLSSPAHDETALSSPEVA